MKPADLYSLIDQNQQQIDANGAFDQDILKKINYKFRLDWNYYSNRMEGGTLTREETRSVMVGNIDVKGKPLKDVLEMNGHDKTVLEILKMGKGIERIAERRVKAIHKAIMHEDDPELANSIGEWKTTRNEIINYKGEKIAFADPSEVKELVHKLLDITNAELEKYDSGKPSKHPLEIAAQFHIDFVTIHPFYDGNGRTTRILTNLILISCGFPPVIIKEQHKKRYYQLLADIQAYGGDPDLFYTFLGERLIESQEIVLHAIEGKDIEEEDDFMKEILWLKEKTKNETAPKSPKTVHLVFENIKTQVWEKLSQTLEQVGELFADKKATHYVNHLEEQFRTRNLLQNPLEISTKPKEPLVFGYNVYKTDIHLIEWRHTMFGLSADLIGGDVVVKLLVELNYDSYTITLKLDDIDLYTYNNHYNSFNLSKEAEKMNRILKSSLLEKIQFRLNVD